MAHAPQFANLPQRKGDTAIPSPAPRDYPTSNTDNTDGWESHWESGSTAFYVKAALPCLAFKWRTILNSVLNSRTTRQISTLHHMHAMLTHVRFYHHPLLIFFSQLQMASPFLGQAKSMFNYIHLCFVSFFFNGMDWDSLGRVGKAS